MIDREHELPLAAQARLLDLSRGCLYYQTVPTADADLELMRIIDGVHLEYPFFGAQRPHSSLGGRTPDMATSAHSPPMRRN